MAAKINFSDIFDQLKTGVTKLAKDTVNDFVSDAKKDGTQILSTIEDDLKRWANLLAKGDLTKTDFEWLVLSRKDSLKMAALERTGLAMIKVDAFKTSVLNLIIDTVLKLI
jgi:hypothetical protein